MKNRTNDKNARKLEVGLMVIACKSNNQFKESETRRKDEGVDLIFLLLLCHHPSHVTQN